MRYTINSGVKNEFAQKKWVAEVIESLGSDKKFASSLDVGAGQSPFKEFLISNGFEYSSHDFNSYQPNKIAWPGLQNALWVYSKHDYICDILDLQPNKQFDLIVCTEVLEHVPDPVAALRKMVDLTKTGGHILITCPFMSLMHQAPFYFSSGLSPYWFMHWSRELNLEIESLQVSGDYLDLMIQENSRLLNSLIRIRGISRIFDLSLKLRSLIPKEIRESAGFGTFALLKKS